jgi:hypothetical protein
VKSAHPGTADDPSQQRTRRSIVTTTATTEWKELASRGDDGLAVLLLWNEATDRIRVTVADERFDEEFHLDVPGAHALGAFHHPFAYAAVRGLRPGASRTSLDNQPHDQRSAV